MKITPRSLIADALAKLMAEHGISTAVDDNLHRADRVMEALSPHYEITAKSYRIDPPGYPD